MITFPELGKIGRLGNHLFQMAATIGAALDNREDFAFPHWEHEREFPTISGCFLNDVPRGPQYHESRFAFDPIPYHPGMELHGFFQSERYFDRYSDYIRTLFTPTAVPPKKEFRGVASVHVRRGDYLQLSDRHPVLEMVWYDRAMDYMRQHGVKQFLVFSDDIVWCQENFPKAPDVEVIPLMAAVTQLALTISCEHHIMANSTFSWWGAWLDPNPSKVVIAPNAWFGPTYGHWDTKDLYCRGWVRM